MVQADRHDEPLTVCMGVVGPTCHGGGPFIWKATAEDIIAKVKRGRETLNQIKTQTDH